MVVAIIIPGYRSVIGLIILIYLTLPYYGLGIIIISIMIFIGLSLLIFKLVIRSYLCVAIWWVVQLGLFICTSISYECSSLISWFNRQSIKLFNGLLGLFKISQHYNRWTSYYCTTSKYRCYFMMHNKYLCVAILYSRIFSKHEIHTFIGP